MSKWMRNLPATCTGNVQSPKAPNACDHCEFSMHVQFPYTSTRTLEKQSAGGIPVHTKVMLMSEEDFTLWGMQRQEILKTSLSFHPILSLKRQSRILLESQSPTYFTGFLHPCDTHYKKLKFHISHTAKFSTEVQNFQTIWHVISRLFDILLQHFTYVRKC